MRNPISCAAAGLLLAAVSSAPVASAQKGTHSDARIGFSLKPPKGWSEVPVPSQEDWIVAQYQSPKEDQIYDKELGQSWRHVQRMLAISFLDDVMNQPDVEKDAETGKTAWVKPEFESYEKWVERYLKTTYGTGFFKADEGEDELKGVPYRWMEIEASGVGKPTLRLLTWLFRLDVGELAVQLECFDAEFKDNKKAFEKVMKSFKTIERTQPLEVAEASFVSISSMRALSPVERKVIREEQESQEWAAMSASLPDGWTAKSVDGVNVVNHTDDRYAKKVVERVKATQKWLEESFATVGPGEYTRIPIVRICESRDEVNVFFSGTGSSAGTAVTTYKDTTAGAMSGTLAYVSQRTMQLWFMDRDYDIWINMPAWLRVGLDQVVGTSSVKRKSLEFDADWWEQVLKDYLRNRGEQEPLPPRKLMTMRAREFAEENIKVDYDAMRLVRLLATTRSKKYQQVMTDYLANLKAVVEEIREEDKKKGNELKKPTNEEEEEAYIEAQKERAKERESRILEEAFSRTFAEWSSSDWADFEAEVEKAN